MKAIGRGTVFMNEPSRSPTQMRIYLTWFILAFASRTLLGGGAAVLLTSVFLYIYGPEFSWMLPAMGVGIIGVGLGLRQLRIRVERRMVAPRDQPHGAITTR